MSSRVKQEGIGLFGLVTMVVGAVIGSGIFNMPSDVAEHAYLGSVMIGWAITIIGMLSIVMTFYIITHRFPHLEGGMFNYAKEAFGPLVGSLTGWGHWLSACLGNCSYAILLFASVGYFFPFFGDGTTWPSFIAAAVTIWIITFFILRGVHQVAFLNSILVITKFIPIILFLILAIVAFKKDLFTTDIWSSAATFTGFDIFTQVKNTMMATLWVFIGVEGAVTVSEDAKNKKDVARASLIGFVFISIIYLMVSLLSFGIMSQSELAALPSPSMGYMLKYLVGDWGGQLIAIGIIISILGALLSWILLSAEILFIAAKNEHLYPKIFALTNKNNAPKGSVIISSLFTTLFLLWITLTPHSNYRMVFNMSAIASILPYLMSALFAIKMVISGRGYQLGEKRGKDTFWSSLAVIYAVWLFVAVGIDKLVPIFLLYLPGLFLYFYAKKEWSH